MDKEEMKKILVEKMWGEWEFCGQPTHQEFIEECDLYGYKGDIDSLITDAIVQWDQEYEAMCAEMSPVIYCAEDGYDY